jgi:hypothetical protein
MTINKRIKSDLLETKMNNIPKVLTFKENADEIKNLLSSMTKREATSWLLVNTDLSQNGINKVLKDLNLGAPSKGSTELTNLVKIIRDNEKVENPLNGKELAKVIAEQTTYSESTAYHHISFLSFAKEWARQERS